jgi:hypothetical protein
MAGCVPRCDRRIWSGHGRQPPDPTRSAAAASDERADAGADTSLVPRVAVFAPNPLLAVALEREGDVRERTHFHPAGQGVWVARMFGCLGAAPVLCGFAGGESGDLLQGAAAA